MSDPLTALEGGKNRMRELAKMVEGSRPSMRALVRAAAWNRAFLWAFGHANSLGRFYG